jgi:uncharacterized membrane protein HdeD (DUF308 family)
MSLRAIDASVNTLTRNWWAVVLRGVAAMLFGLFTFVVPGISLAVLVFLFAGYAIVDGVLALISAIRRRGRAEPWWLLLFEGVAGITAGILTLLWPGISALALVTVIAIWALVTGCFEIVQAIRLRKQIRGEWLLVIDGILSVILGVLLLIAPAPGALALVIVIGAYALIFGALLVALGLRLRTWRARRNIDVEAPPITGPIVQPS